jgi:NAD(P)H dehydrogenase (quinone)
MKTITVIYHSASGHTAKMAEAVAKGAALVAGVKVQTINIEGKDIVEGRYKNDGALAQLDASDAIIFGSPTSRQTTRTNLPAKRSDAASRNFC